MDGFGLGRSLDCSDAQGVSARPPTTPSGTGVNESNSVVWTVVSRPFVSINISLYFSQYPLGVRMGSRVRSPLLTTSGGCVGVPPRCMNF